MMNEEFIKRIYKTIVEEGEKYYLNIYENTQITKRTVNIWKNALELYRTFTDNEKKVFIEILKLTMIETISSVFGILDGSSTLSGLGEILEFDVRINGMSTENELQDIFLEFVEENTTGIFR